MCIRVKDFKDELHLRYFGFSGVSSDLFQHLQWSTNPKHHFYYRLFMMIYVVTWLVVGYITDLSDNFWQEVTYWSEGLMVIYFTFAFGVSAHHMKTKSENAQQNAEHEAPLRWFHRIMWMLFSTSATAAFSVTVLFWFLVAPDRLAERNLRPITFHLHTINSVLMSIEVFMVAFPVRVLHFVFPMTYVGIYVTFTLILHFTGINSKIYPSLNFEDDFSGALRLVLLVIFVGQVMIHVSVFSLYLIRKFLVSMMSGKISPETIKPKENQKEVDESQKTETDLPKDEV